MLYVYCSKNVHLVFLKLNYENINNVIFSKFTQKGMSIDLENFIDEKYGNVKLYKSKKRLELRLHKNFIKDHGEILY